MNTETNAEFLKRVIDESPNDMMGPFIIDALIKKTDEILKANESLMKAAFGRTMISWECWKDCAERLKKELDKKYSP